MAFHSDSQRKTLFLLLTFLLLKSVLFYYLLQVGEKIILNASVIFSIFVNDHLMSFLCLEV